MVTPTICDVSCRWHRLIDEMRGGLTAPRRLYAAVFASVLFHVGVLASLGIPAGRVPISNGRHLEVMFRAADTNRSSIPAEVKEAQIEPAELSVPPGKETLRSRAAQTESPSGGSVKLGSESIAIPSVAQKEAPKQPQPTTSVLEVTPVPRVSAMGGGAGFSRVEIEFDVQRDVQHGQEKSVGQGRYLYVADGYQYGVSVVDGVNTEPGWRVESSGIVTPQGLSPQLIEISGEYGEQLIALSGSSTRNQEGSIRRRMRDGLLDRQSLVFYFSLQPPSPKGGELLLSDGRAYKKYRYSISGREEVHVPLIGVLKATRIQLRPDAGNELIELWLVPEIGNLPVRMRFRDEHGVEVVQAVTKLIYR